MRSLQLSGAEAIGVALARGLAGAGHNVEVVVLEAVPPGQPSRLGELQRAGISVRFLGKSSGASARVPLALWAAVRRSRPDLVHTHGLPAVYLVPALLRYRQLAWVHTVHCPAEHEVPSSVQPLFRWFYRTRRLVPVANSAAVARSVEALYGVPSPAVIANGIDLSAYREPVVAPSEWRARHGLPDQAFVIACVARLRPEKGHAHLIRALRLLREDTGDGWLLLAGDGPEEPSLRTLAAQLGVQDYVRFLGPRRDVPDILHASQAFALPSHFEGFGLSAVEAGAAGRPIVASDVGGLAEIFTNDHSALLCPPGDEHALAAALGRLQRSAELRSRLAGSAGSLVAERYSAEAMVASYLTVYEQAVSKRRRR